MDSLKEKYRQIIQKILEDYAAFLGQEDGIQQELIFDRERAIIICSLKQAGTIENAFMVPFCTSTS
jgi:hypothetical protein